MWQCWCVKLSFDKLPLPPSMGNSYAGDVIKNQNVYHEKLQELEPLYRNINNIKKDHNNKIGELIFSVKSTKVQTDVNGYYQFPMIKRGKYLLLSRHKVSDNKITWLTIAEIKDRENKLDLRTDNSIMVDIFYDEN